MTDSLPSRTSKPRNVDGPGKSREGFTVAQLKPVPLLHGMSRENLELACTVIARRVLTPGEVLLTEDASDSTLFFLMEGAFKITVRKGDSMVLLGLCGRGELLGELAAIDGLARSATVTAQTPCEVGVLRASDFWSMIWPLEPVAANMAHQLAGRVRRLTAKVQAMATLDVRGRLAFQLASLARDHFPEENGDRIIPYGLTQTELAQMIGTSRVQVNQLMKIWNRNGFLTGNRNSLIIHDLDALCQMFPPSLETIAPRASYGMNGYSSMGFAE